MNTTRPTTFHKKMSFYWLIALALVLGAGCATTSGQMASRKGPPATTTEASGKAAQAQMAQTTVTNAINALRQNNELVFKQHLSTNLLSDYRTQFFDMWVAEVAKTQNLVVGSVRFESADLRKASVNIGFTVSGQRQDVAVRLVREQGVWKWAER